MGPKKGVIIMDRFLALLLAIAMGVAGSQAPGFTLQYMQNLTGRVDELRPLVQQFDADVGRYNYTRESALSECATADGLLEALCSSFATTVRRFITLSEHLAELKAAEPLRQPLVLAQSYKEDIAKSTLDAYKPAVPTTLDGAVYGGGTFAAGWLIFSVLFGGIGSLFGRGRRDEYAF